MNLYELTYLISPKIASEEAEEFSKKQSKTLKDLGATLYQIENPKKINLAYEINGFSEAYLTSVDLDITTEKVKLIEEKLKRENDVLRFLIVSKDKIEEDEDEKEMKKKAEKESKKKEDDKEEKKDDNNEEEVKENDDEKEDEKESKKKEDDKEEKKEVKKSKKEKKVKLNEIDEKIDEIL